MKFEEIQELIEPAKTKIVLFVLDGLGGLPYGDAAQTALEAAHSPHMNELARQGICGLHTPVAPGITPGSGPSHLGLFGYDPLEYQVGRGTLSALGIDFDLQPGDVAARGNFCTLDAQGNVTDRRAGRIGTEKNRELIAMLEDIEVDGVEIFLETVKEYRLLLVLRGENLSAQIGNTDPQETGIPPLPPRAITPGAEDTVQKLAALLDQVRARLAGQQPANMILLRGFSQQPNWPRFPDVFGVRAGAIAAYPMYRGVAKLVGMDVLGDAKSFEDELDILESRWNDYDFFFLHFKTTDSRGEDGDFEGKVAAIESVDRLIPHITALKPDVLAITGDHSTPAIMRSHSWHPVPTLLWSPYCRRDNVPAFGERACMQGGLGPRIPSKQLMPLALANAQRLKKYGA